MKDLKDRILDVAMELAAEGGFENVRQRDVAARAGIALGTLYKRFRSKEDILSALLEREALVLERRMDRKPIEGASRLDRIDAYYQTVTRTLCKKPHLARAMLRAMTSGDARIAGNVASYHQRMARLVIAAMRGVGHLGDAGDPTPPTPDELTLAIMLQHVWFASLVGWSANLHGPASVVAMMRTAAELLVRGQEARSGPAAPGAPQPS